MLQSHDSIVIQDSLVYSRRLFAIGSVLPHQQNPKRFRITILYMFLVVTLQLWDVYDNLYDLETLLVTATEWPFTFSLVVSLVLIRTNQKLITVVDKIQHEINDPILFESDEEKRLYRKYNIISVNFGKYVLAFVTVIIYMYYCRPAISLLTHSRTDAENNTRPFVLPFRMHIFFDYEYDAKMYTLLYLYQLPATYVSFCHVAQASLIVTSTLHVCARFSVLAYRIRVSLTKFPKHFRQRMRTMVIEHLELMELSNFINDSFKTVLLIEYLNCSFRLAISMYVVLITLGKDMVAFVNFCMYSVLVLCWLYLYSYIGEQLTYQSLNVGEAFYDIEWTDITARDRKSLVICMMNGQQAQYLMGGKFYKFTLFGFSDIMKSAMAFFSVIRTTVE